MKFRIVQSGQDGKYYVEKKGWFFWRSAVGTMGPLGTYWPAAFDTQDEAIANLNRLYKTPDRVVWESE